MQPCVRQPCFVSLQANNFVGQFLDFRGAGLEQHFLSLAHSASSLQCFTHSPSHNFNTNVTPCKEEIASMQPKKATAAGQHNLLFGHHTNTCCTCTCNKFQLLSYHPVLSEVGTPWAMGTSVMHGTQRLPLHITECFSCAYSSIAFTAQGCTLQSLVPAKQEINSSLTMANACQLPRPGTKPVLP